MHGFLTKATHFQTIVGLLRLYRRHIVLILQLFNQSVFISFILCNDFINFVEFIRIMNAIELVNAVPQRFLKATNQLLHLGRRQKRDLPPGSLACFAMLHP